MDQNPNNPTSNDPFNYDPIILDDELHELVNSVVQPTPQTDDVYSAIFSENNQQPPQDQYTTTLLPNVRNLSVDTSHDHQPIPPHEHVNNVGASSKGKGKKISNARDVERQRRQEMSSLYHDLRSLLPDEYVKGKRSKSDLVQETINYINNLQIGIEELNETKNKLSRTVKKRSAASRSSSSSNNNTNNAQQKYNVTVKPCNEGYIEVIVHTNATHENDHDHDHDNDNDDDEDSSNRSLALSKVLRKLSEEGLDVLNCVSSRIDETLVHTIQAQIEDGREIDLGLLQQKLMFHY